MEELPGFSITLRNVSSFEGTVQEHYLVLRLSGYEKKKIRNLWLGKKKLKIEVVTNAQEEV